MSSEYDCTVTGTDGVDLPKGTVITGAAVRDVVLCNGIVKVLYTARTPDVERGSHMLQRRIDGVYTDTMQAAHADYSYFRIAIGVLCDRVVVLENTAARVKVAFEWTAFSLSSGGDGGPLIINVDGSLSYPEGSSTAKRHATTKLRKVIVLCQGREGYFVGWHTDPLIGPQGKLLYVGSAYNNENAHGERELGPGDGVAVAFSSAGVVSRHPESGDAATWDALEASQGVQSNHPTWSGIGDPYFTAPIFQHALYAPTQAAGFPGTQLVGPWWTASLAVDDDAEPYPVCRYVVMRKPCESGTWQYGSTYGIHVTHYVNEWHDDDGRPFETMLFIGAYPYESDEDITTEAGRAEEPSAALQTAIAARAAGDFDACGRAAEVAVFRHTSTVVKEI
jgi:hypothetical protein